MPTRIYPRTNIAAVSCNGSHLASILDLTLSRVGHSISITPNDIHVTHNELTAADDAAITNAINTYIFDENFGIPQAELNLRNIVTTLRQWSNDAKTTETAWDGMSNTQRFAALKVVINRLGITFDRLADLMQVHKLGQ